MVWERRSLRRDSEDVVRLREAVNGAMHTEYPSRFDGKPTSLDTVAPMDEGSA
jgi:hypothetical protein